MGFDKIKNQIKKGEFNYISAWPLIQASKPLDFQEKTVLFGDRSLAARDTSPTPLDGELDNPLIFCILQGGVGFFSQNPMIGEFLMNNIANYLF